MPTVDPLTPQTEDLSACIAACEAARRACDNCAAEDAHDGDPMMAACILINLDCAAMCGATLGALARGSVHHGDFCALCAHLCKACAEECGKHDHEHCIRCREACKLCAQACQKHAAERHAM